MRIKYLLFIHLLALVLSGCKLASVAYQEMDPAERTKRIQESLVTLKYLNDTPDGVLGPKTRDAITRFQKDKGMAVDGEVSQSVYIQTGLAVSSARKPSTNPLTNTGPKAVVTSGSMSSAQVRTSSPGENPSCRYANWEGVVENLVDLFSCDQARAIASLSSGRKVNFYVTSVSFQAGKLYANSFIQSSVAREAARAMNDRQKQFSWNNWFAATQSDSGTFVCVFEGSRAAGVRARTAIQVWAVLESYSEGSGVLKCR